MLKASRFTRNTLPPIAVGSLLSLEVRSLLSLAVGSLSPLPFFFRRHSGHQLIVQLHSRPPRTLRRVLRHPKRCQLGWLVYRNTWPRSQQQHCAQQTDKSKLPVGPATHSKNNTHTHTQGQQVNAWTQGRIYPATVGFTSLCAHMSAL